MIIARRTYLKAAVLVLLFSAFTMPNFGASFAASPQPQEKDVSSPSLEAALTKINALLNKKYSKTGNHEASPTTALDDIILHRETLLLIDVRSLPSGSEEIENKKKDVAFLKKIKKAGSLTTSDIKIQKVDEQFLLKSRHKYEATPHYKDAKGNFYISRQLDILHMSYPVEMEAPFNPILAPANDILKFMVEKK